MERQNRMMSVENSLRKSYYLFAQSLELSLLMIKTRQAYCRKMENIKENRMIITHNPIL